MPASDEKIRLILAHEPAHCGKHGWHTDWSLSGKIAVCWPCRRERSKVLWQGQRIRFALETIKSKNRNCEIDENFIVDLIVKQNNRCALSGILFSEAALPSIDRIDSTKDYTKNNIQIVIMEINYMKRSMSQDLFISLCKAVGRMNGQT